MTQLTLQEFPPPVMAAISLRASTISVSVGKYITIAYLCRKKWPRLVERSKRASARRHMVSMAEEFREWAESKGHQPGGHQVWIEIAMLEWCGECQMIEPIDQGSQ